MLYWMLLFIVKVLDLVTFLLFLFLGANVLSYKLIWGKDRKLRVYRFVEMPLLLTTFWLWLVIYFFFFWFVWLKRKMKSKRWVKKKEEKKVCLVGDRRGDRKSWGLRSVFLESTIWGEMVFSQIWGENERKWVGLMENYPFALSPIQQIIFLPYITYIHLFLVFPYILLLIFLILGA